MASYRYVTKYTRRRYLKIKNKTKMCSEQATEFLGTNLFSVRTASALFPKKEE